MVAASLRWLAAPEIRPQSPAQRLQKRTFGETTMKAPIWLAAAAALLLPMTVAHGALAQSAGEGVFNTRCKMCHDPAIERAPTKSTLATYPAATIVDALTNGVMKPMAAGLSDADKQAVAAYLTGAAPAEAPAAPVAPARPQGRPTPAAVGVDVKCQVNPPIKATGSDWTSVGLDRSHRYQANPGLTAAEVPKLKVKWSFAMSGGSMPTVIGDWLFITNRSGKFYALDANTGCVRWVLPDVTSRTTPMIVRSPISPSGWLTVVGVRDRTARAYDA